MAIPKNKTQKRREPRQPQPNSTANGTLIADAIAAIRDIVVAYMPVTLPTLPGILTFTKGISKTLQITMPIPVRPVPIKRIQGPPNTLRIDPTVSITIPSRIARAWPSLFPIPAENKENVAKLIKGKVVKKPAQAFESPKSSRIKGIKGPTAVIDGRSVKETRRIPKSKNPGLSDDGNLYMDAKLAEFMEVSSLF